MFTILKGLGLFLIPVGMVSAQIPPESQLFVMNELEHVYFDNTGPAGFKLGGIVPCTNYVDSSTGGLPNNALGRQTTAQWIRTAFRKFDFLVCFANYTKILEVSELHCTWL